MRRPIPTGKSLLSFVAIAVLFCGPIAKVAEAQNPPQRQIRTYIPPDQLVSFLPSTPFSQFIEFVDPIFLRVTGKRIVDPESRTQPIGVSIASMHFFDAFELVLQYNQLTYSESEQFFIVEPAVTVDPATGQIVEGAGIGSVMLPATHETREIQINALLFEIDHTLARDTGIDWNVFFGQQQGGQGGQGGGGGGGGGLGGQQGQNQPRFFLKTDDIFSSLDDIITAPSRIDFAHLTQFFRLLETEGVGETVASPHVTVQSGVEGRMQIGSDVPVQVRDFAGNTITQFFSTGIIVDVTPTFVMQQVEDSTGLHEFEFVHLDVQVEKSGSTPSASGPVIDRSTANTQVLLLDGEQTVIGGLYTTEESVSRRGIPVLKDLPGWFFGLRYIFGRTQRAVSQKELVIVLQARVLDNLQERARRPLNRELLEQTRRQIDEGVRRFDSQVGATRPAPRAYVKPDSGN